MKKQSILIVLLATLIISSAVFAGPKPSPTTHGAIWGGSSAVTVNNPGIYHQSFVQYLKSIAKGLGVLVEGAIWG